MLLKNIKTGFTYEVPSAVYNAMENQTKGKFQVINKEDAVNIPEQKIKSNLTEEEIANKKIKKTKPKKENL
jgi:hypothetical protein